jgi:hypothetical protein
MSTFSANSTSDTRSSQIENDTLTLNWEPKVLNIRGVRHWEVENDQDVIRFCKKQLSKVCVTYKFSGPNYRTFQKPSNSLLRPIKAPGIHTFTGRKW